MADSLNLPRDVAEVTTKMEPLYKYLVQVTNTINNQNKIIADLQTQITELKQTVTDLQN